MLPCLIILLALSPFLMKVNGRVSLSTGLRRIGTNILSRGVPTRMLKTGSSITSLYVGSTGIWWRSGIIAAINQLEQGKKEEAMETLNIAIATLTVFDITQGTVSPIASELIHQLVKHRGNVFPKTYNGLTKYNKVLAQSTITEKAGNVDEIIDNANFLKKQIGQYFEEEVKAVIQKTQIVDDLVTSLKNTKQWAKALTWADTITGPLFDAANVAFCGWQLHNAIHDKHSSNEERALNIASSSLGVASGTVGVVSFVAGALAVAGSTLAAVAGPVGAIIGCILGLASIIIDLINSQNPHTTIKDHLKTIQNLKKGSLQYLENNINLTKMMTSSFSENVGFDTIYQVNQGNLIVAMRSYNRQSIKGVENDRYMEFNIRTSPGQENKHLTMGKSRDFDKSKYANWIWTPRGKVPLGSDFYGKEIKPNGKGTTVFATTPMVAELFWIRGVHVDTRLENDEAAPDNVIIGEMTGLVLSGCDINVNTGAGDDLVQIAGLICNQWNSGCLDVDMGSGVNTLSFQGMNYDRLLFPRTDGTNYVFAGMEIHLGISEKIARIYYILQESKTSLATIGFPIGDVIFVDVLYGSPFDDEIWIPNNKDYVLKSDNGTNKYVIPVYERDFTHTITDDSPTFGSIFLVGKTRPGNRYYSISISDVAYSKETKTLVVFIRNAQKKHTFTGRIILKRTKPGDIGNMKLYLVSTFGIDPTSCPVRGLRNAYLHCRSSKTLNEESRQLYAKSRYGNHASNDDRPVPSVPFQYDLDVDLTVKRIPNLCGDFIIALSCFRWKYIPAKGSYKHTLNLPENSYLVIDDYFVSEWTKYDERSGYPAFYYHTKEKTLFYETRYPMIGYRHKKPADARGTIAINIPEAKRIVVGTAGSYQLVLDIKHDNRPAVNLASEYEALTSRPKKDYNFKEDFIDAGDKPKQIVLGTPSKTATNGKQLKITLGKARTAYGKKYEKDATGDYAENALIVNNVLKQHLLIEGNSVQISFQPDSRVQSGWVIHVKERNQVIHQVLVTGADTLAYHENLVRVHLHDLVKGEKKHLDLNEMLTNKVTPVIREIMNKENICN